jgi:hypothetical protein
VTSFAPAFSRRSARLASSLYSRRQSEASYALRPGLGGCALCHDALPANEPQCSFAQNVGMALALAMDAKLDVPKVRAK